MSAGVGCGVQSQYGQQAGGGLAVCWADAASRSLAGVGAAWSADAGYLGTLQ